MPARKSVRRGAKKSVRRGAKKSRVKLISDILSSKYGVQSDSKSDKPKKKKCHLILHSVISQKKSQKDGGKDRINNFFFKYKILKK